MIFGLQTKIIMIVSILGLAFFGYMYVANLQDELETLEYNNQVLKNNIITQQSKCEEDIAIEKANIKIKTIVKWKTKYIKKVDKDEEPTNDKFMLNTNTVQ